MNIAKNLQILLAYLMRFSLIIAILLAAWEQLWMLVFVSSAVFILTFLPSMIEKRLHIFLPLEFEFIIIAFIYATLFLGEVQGYYTRFWWWDSLLHFGSAIVLGIIGFLIIYTLNYEPKIKIKLDAKFIALFAFSFAVMIGAVWEIFEFAMDQFFGMNMQKSGLVDTMYDLIIDTIGAIIASVAGYFYIKGGEVPLFNNMIEKFVEDNPKLFKRVKE